MNYLSTAAILSDCGKYRYDLHRTWDATKPRLLWLMLNPSKADASQDDPTISKCVRYAAGWGYGGFVVVNLFAFRATEPDDMLKADDPVGPVNDEMIRSHAINAVAGGAPVICAWGAEVSAAKRPVIRERPYKVLDLLRGVGVKPQCLTLTKTGQPGHPLFLKGTLVPVEWTRKAVQS